MNHEYEEPRCLCGTKLVVKVEVPVMVASIRSGGKMGMLKINPNSQDCNPTYLICAKSAFPSQYSGRPCNNEYEFSRDYEGRIIRGKRI